MKTLNLPNFFGLIPRLTALCFSIMFMLACPKNDFIPDDPPELSTSSTSLGMMTDMTEATEETPTTTESESSGTTTDQTTETSSGSTAEVLTDSATSSDTTSTTGEPVCREETVTCAQLMEEFGWDPQACEGYEGELDNMSAANLAMTQIVEPRYASCQGMDAFDQVGFLLATSAFQGQWKQLEKRGLTENCFLHEVLTHLMNIDGFFAWVEVPQEPEQKFTLAQIDQNFLYLEVCGMDKDHTLAGLTLLVGAGNDDCTADLEQGIENGALKQVQVYSLSPDFSVMNGEADILFNNPLHSPEVLNVLVTGQKPGKFCVVPKTTPEFIFVHDGSLANGEILP